MRILVTGTSRGIGKAIAEYFLKKGHEVIGFDRDDKTIDDKHYRHYVLDIRKKETYPDLGPIEILINNAGVQNEDDIDVDLKGTIKITEHYLNADIKSILNIGSASGHTGSEFPEYCAAKAVSSHIRRMSLYESLNMVLHVIVSTQVASSHR